MNWRRGPAVLIAVALASALLAGCRDSSASGGDAAPQSMKPRKGGALTYGIETDPNGLDPSRNAWDPVGLLVANALYDTLASFDANGLAQPYLAESFEHNDTYDVWTMRLRPGITFSDGAPLDAEALRDGWWTALRSSLITGQATVDFNGMKIIDPLTVEFTTEKPWASMPAIFTGQGGYVASPRQLFDPTVKSSTTPIGTGPFKLESWDIGKRLTVVRNDNYWRKDADGVKLPYIDRVTFEVVPEASARVAGLNSGILDIVRGTTFAEIKHLEELAATKDIKIERDQATAAKTLVMFNTAKAPLNDIRVRRALAHATNKEALAAAFSWPRDRLADSPFTPDSPWYSKVDQPGFDLPRAKQLIAEYTADTGKPVKLTLSGAYEPEVLQAIQAQWALAGADVTIETVDFKEYVIFAVMGRYDAVLFRYFGATDPDTLWHFWSSQTVKGINEIGLNFSRVADKQIDEGINTGRSSPYPAKRKEGYDLMQRRFGDLTPYVWLYHEAVAIAHRAQVRTVRNGTLPDGSKAYPHELGVHRLAETWLETGS